MFSSLLNTSGSTITRGAYSLAKAENIAPYIMLIFFDYYYHG